MLVPCSGHIYIFVNFFSTPKFNLLLIINCKKKKTDFLPVDHLCFQNTLGVLDSHLETINKN